MAYIQGAARDQTLLLPPAVEDFVAPDNPVRAIDAFVESLDLEKLGFALRAEGEVGRASYHPGMLLKLYLWGYFSRTRSSRRLEEACAVNLNAIWLTGNLRPDHSTISDFRQAHAKALQQLFQHFNLLCLELGLFGRELVAIDGSFIKAVNSRSRSFTRTKLARLLETIDQSVARYLAELEEADGREAEAGTPAGVQGLRDKIEQLQARRGQLEALVEQCQNSATGQVNQSDPDSRQLRKRGQHTVGYNLQCAVDGQHHLVASCELTQEPTDIHQLDAMAQQAKADLGLPAQAPLQVLADKGYGCAVELAACEAHHTQAIVPLPKSPKAGDGSLPVSAFTYDRHTDSYRCPEGKTLGRKRDDRREGGNAYRVYYDAGQCLGCPQLGRCTKGRYRKLKISLHEPALAAVRQRLQTQRELYRRRKALAEHPFATLKDWNGGKDLLCRGLELATAEMRLSFWAYNFKRAISVLGLGRLLEGIQRGSLVPAD